MLKGAHVALQQSGMSMTASPTDAPTSSNRGEPGEGSSPTAFWALTIGSVGVVYGDIGTSPLYALREAVAAAVGPEGLATRGAVLGVLSLILWALIVVVTAKYVIILLRADNNGEGGTLALMALAQRALGKSSGLVVLCGIISAALFYGDAVITPALSVLSAIEGLKLITPAFDHFVVPLTVVILIGLFAVQSHGTARVAAWFGPITAVWFIAIAIPGVCAHHRQPGSPAGLQSGLCGGFHVLAWRDRADHARRGLPGGHRRGSALRRPRPFRPPADPDGVGRFWSCPRSRSIIWGRARWCCPIRRRSRTRSF